MSRDPTTPFPRATYRLQFNADFTFEQARDIAGYLSELGISDLYASPLFRAAPGSTHGYDVCSFVELNPALGAEKNFRQLTARLRELGLGLLLDMVPNHMSASPWNDWWRDVLEKGQGSPWASFFDIAWQPLSCGGRSQILLPVLEAPYAQVLEAGKLRVQGEGGRFVLNYHDRKFPLSAESCESLRKLAPGGPDEFNGKPGHPQSFDNLHALLQTQHYRLAHWRTAADEINYRRFFDVTELVSLRMELRPVFEGAHELVFRLLREKTVTGLRIDHPDGLWNPKQYFDRLWAAFPDAAPYVVVEKILTGDEAMPADWAVSGTTGYEFLNRVNGLFVDSANERAFDRIYRDFTGSEQEFSTAAEAGKRKVLRLSFRSELNRLANSLKSIAEGTRSGQDFTLFQIRAALKEVLIAFPVYRSYVTEETGEVSAADKEFIQRAIRIASERSGSSDHRLFDFIERLLLLRPPEDLDQSLREAARAFVQRFQQLSGPVTAKGLEDTAFYNFHRLVSLNEVGGDPGKFGVAPVEFHRHNLLTRAQWPHTLLATATHDTKRGEDVRARVNVLSEMPARWEEAVKRWSALNADKKVAFEGRPAPHPNDEYLLYQTLVGAGTPEAAPPAGGKGFRKRIVAYMLKALKEAKARTSWTDPNAAYEAAMQAFVEKILDPTSSAPFLEDFQRFLRTVSSFGQLNSLSQTLLKITSPGVPDFYQGTELWDLNLVDPDNRQPVDYVLRRRLLEDLKNKFPAPGADFDPALTRNDLERLWKESQSGQIKLFLIWQALGFRHRHPQLFSEGDYVPLTVTGPQAKHVCAFARTDEKETSLTIVPRLVYGLTGGDPSLARSGQVWQDTSVELGAGLGAPRFRHVFTNQIVISRGAPDRPMLLLREVLEFFPVALLEKIS